MKKESLTIPPELWVVLMHQRTVFGPFTDERVARAWAATQLAAYHYPAPEGVLLGGAA